MGRNRRRGLVRLAGRSRHRIRKRAARERLDPRLAQGRGSEVNPLERAFAAGGPLAATVSAFKPRAQQVEMARAIHDAMQRTAVLVAEAGTGTGKTFAYLVPALLARGKVIVSTGTKT